jgi:hypothetical protein
MTTVQRTVLGLALAASLALSPTPAVAGSTAVKPPVKNLLTTEELACQYWGIVYHGTATDRDRLVPITRTIEVARNIAFRSFADNPSMLASLVAAVRDVYAHPEISPDQYRAIKELACMNLLVPPTAAGPQY